MDIMKNRKERRHAVKQANTLETSKKTLMKALMGALHNGGFLFSNNGQGAISPVIVNVTVQQLVVAVLAFLFSRTRNGTEVADLLDYVGKTAEALSKMRLKDLPPEDNSSKC